MPIERVEHTEEQRLTSIERAEQNLARLERLNRITNKSSVTDDLVGSSESVDVTSDSHPDSPQALSPTGDENVKASGTSRDVVKTESEALFASSQFDKNATESGDTPRIGKLEPNSSYERGGCIYETDTEGRVCTVSGQIKLGEGVRDQQQQREVGKLGVKTDEAGHLIATRFNGSPEGVNLVPQDMNLNRSDWKKMENEWAKGLKAGKEVEVVVSVLYEQDSMRPMGFHVLDTIDGVSHERQFVNVPHGKLI